MARVLAASAVEELRDRHVGEPEGIVDLTVRDQTAVGGDPGAVELQLDPAVEIDLSGDMRKWTRSDRRNWTP
jgi:hypothetical protein